MLRGAATDKLGRIWLGGSFDEQVWVGQDALSSPFEFGLLVRLNP